MLPEEPAYAAAKPELIAYISEGVRDHYAYLDATLASYRATATLLVGFCSPSSAALIVFASQALTSDVSWPCYTAAAALFISAMAAGISLRPCPWWGAGQLSWAWFRAADETLLKPEAIANTKITVLNELHYRSLRANENSAILEKMILWIRISIVAALTSPVAALVSYLLGLVISAF